MTYQIGILSKYSIDSQLALWMDCETTNVNDVALMEIAFGLKRQLQILWKGDIYTGEVYTDNVVESVLSEFGLTSEAFKYYNDVVEMQAKINIFLS